jgi:hypothetical protein
MFVLILQLNIIFFSWSKNFPKYFPLKHWESLYNTFFKDPRFTAVDYNWSNYWPI